jgi:hypothetical protein
MWLHIDYLVHRCAALCASLSEEHTASIIGAQQPRRSLHWQPCPFTRTIATRLLKFVWSHIISNIVRILRETFVYRFATVCAFLSWIFCVACVMTFNKHLSLDFAEMQYIGRILVINHMAMQGADKWDLIRRVPGSATHCLREPYVHTWGGGGVHWDIWIVRCGWKRNLERKYSFLLSRCL